jgi:hypothetical protein
MSLFQKSVVNKYLKNLDRQVLLDKWNTYKNHFLNPSVQVDIRNLKEEQYQGEFLEDLFVKILGYTKPASSSETKFNLTTEYKNVKDSKKADGAIIFDDKVKAVIELKGTNTTDLGKIEVQAFGYKNNQPDCVYVITSNFEKLRFYIDNAIEHIEFNLFTLTEEEFQLLYLCLGYDNLSQNVGKKIKDESLSEEDVITKKLYKDYSLFKRELHQNLVLLNPNFEPLELFKKSQKLLDRFLFLFFGEDRHLLPPNSVRLILSDWKDLQERDEEIPLYKRFKKYFEYLNVGYKGKRYDVFAYNGGLFKPDEVLDSINIDDNLLYKHTLKLSEYDFASEVDVNILGHIFENSLNELDEIKAQLEGQVIDKTKTKRKKDGVFYTPKYITKYIVENTVGKLCEEKKQALEIIEEEYFTDKKRQKKTIQGLVEKLDDYRKWLFQLTICDPACGSGAFLNQALDFLIEEHHFIDELQAKLFGDAMVMSDMENSILENNLYGVDLNEESVEIAKLSLWLRTAQPNRKLNDLNGNIKCGNSLIDDIIEAGDKAFNWQQAFPKVFEKGGFDVIIGNPPYVMVKDNSYYEKVYSTYKSKDLYVYFYEKSLNLLKEKGLLGLITPSSFLTNIGFVSLREFLIEYNIEYIIDLGENVFNDASVDSAILIVKNQLNKENIINCSDSSFEFKLVEKSIFRKLDNSIFNIYINPRSLELAEKIFSQNKTLNEYVKFSRGIEFGFKSEEISKIKKSEDYKPILCGGDINKNKIDFQNSYVIHNKENLGIYKSKSIYEQEKILIKRIGNNIVGCYDDRAFYNVCDVYNLQLIENDNYNLKTISVILNSKLINFCYDTKFKSLKKLFPKIPIQNLKLLPIPAFNKINQNEILNSAQIILNTNITLLETTQKFQRTIQRKFELEELPKKLQDWYKLSYAEFIKELAKKKVKLSLSQEAEWEDHFLVESKKALELKATIDASDKAIDAMVYELYGLSEEEIALVEKS